MIGGRFICKRVTVALPEETFITAATIWFVIAYMPASTVGYTLLPIPPRIRIVPRSTNNSTPNAAYPIVLCGRILANAAVPIILMDALHASDLLPQLRIYFGTILTLPMWPRMMRTRFGLILIQTAFR